MSHQSQFDGEEQQDVDFSADVKLSCQSGELVAHTRELAGDTHLAGDSQLTGDTRLTGDTQLTGDTPSRRLTANRRHTASSRNTNIVWYTVWGVIHQCYQLPSDPHPSLAPSSHFSGHVWFPVRHSLLHPSAECAAQL